MFFQAQLFSLQVPRKSILVIKNKTRIRLCLHRGQLRFKYKDSVVMEQHKRKVQTGGTCELLFKIIELHEAGTKRPWVYTLLTLLHTHYE